jgi:alanine dehydrogenase
MNIGLAKENPLRERRVVLTPGGVQTLVKAGHTVYFEKGVGDRVRFSDADYLEVGGSIVYSAEEVYGRSNLVLKITPPTVEDIEKLNAGEVILSSLNLPVAGRRVTEKLLEKRITAIGYELTEDNDGTLPVLTIMSEIAGQMVIPIAARFLESGNEGRGILLGGVAGIPPAAVVILGAGTVGQAATHAALGIGAQVIVVDKDLNRLRQCETIFQHRVTTSIANQYTIERGVQFADVLIGAVMVKGERTPLLITEEMVKTMKRGAVIIDVSIDQGGCVETSRPTTHDNPVFVKHHVIHYCVPNIAASVARSATYALTNAVLPFVQEIAQKGVTNALRSNRGLAAGVCIHNGICTNSHIAAFYQLPTKNILEAL